MQQSTRTSILKERNSNSSHNVIKLAGDEIVRASHDESISCRSNNSDQKSPKNGHQYSELTTSTVTSDGLIRALTTRTFTMPELKITVRPREAQNNGNMPSFLSRHKTRSSHILSSQTYGCSRNIKTESDLHQLLKDLRTSDERLTIFGAHKDTLLTLKSVVKLEGSSEVI
jgi:hypothetical protein